MTFGQQASTCNIGGVLGFRLREAFKSIDVLFLDHELNTVRKAVKEIEADDLLHQHDNKTVTTGQRGRRRAAVFYVDRGAGGLAHVNWWLYTWRFLGLARAEQGLDLVMMTHPATVARMPPECVRVEEDFRGDIWQIFAGKLGI